MKSMNRQFGKLMGKGAGDNAKVSVLIADYEDADKTLTKIIEASKSWRDAWVSILSVQLGSVSAFEELYNPILGTSDHGHDPVMTPQLQLDRTALLKQTFAELKTDLLEEVIMMDARVIKPATDAKDYLQPVRKTIKKRENKRLDWEHYIDKVNHASKKMKRTDRENAALTKAEEELAKAADEFKVADDHLRESLPPLVSAAFAILPHLLAVQIMIQNTLLAQYYTSLHNYCDEAGFPSPSPPMEHVTSTWERDFKPIQKEVESINVIARGRVVHQSMSLGDDANKKTSSVTGLNVRNGFANRRASSQGISPNPRARVMRIPSSNSIQTAPEPSPSPESEYNTHLTPESSYPSQSPAGPTGDYFQRGLGQKKKPPPPPPKRIQNSSLYAKALYSFAGEGQGDLCFREGDMIKVVKKTDSTDDWWEGELRGIKGSFPANYCKIA